MAGPHPPAGGGARLAAALFALHPVNVESAAWVAQLKGTLSLLLTLVSLLWYLRYEQRGGPWRYWLSLGIFVLAGLAKGMALTLPIVLLACAWWQRNRITRRDLLRVVPFVLIGLLMAGLEVWLQGRSAAVMGVVVRSDGFLSRLAVAGCAVWFYFWKLIWPVNLLFVYPRWQIDRWSLLAFLPGLLLVLILAVAWWQRRTWGRPVVMLLICYVGLLGPALGFVNVYFMRFSLVADHYQYAAMIVPCAVFAGLVAALCGAGGNGKTGERRGGEGETGRRGDSAASRDVPVSPSPLLPLSPSSLSAARLVALAFGVGLLATLAALTFRQSRILRRQGNAVQGHHRRQSGLLDGPRQPGEFLADEGRLDEAIDCYRNALRIFPDCVESRNNLGRASRASAGFDEAVTAYRRALAAGPNDAARATIRNNLAAALTDSRRFDEAAAEYGAMLDSQPGLAGVHLNLGNVLAAQGRLDEAIAHFHIAGEINPGLTLAGQNLRLAASERDRLLKTLADWRQSLRANPDDVACLNNIAWWLATNPNASIRNGPEAVELARRAVRLSGGRQPAVLSTMVGRLRRGRAVFRGRRNRPAGHRPGPPARTTRNWQKPCGAGSPSLTPELPIASRRRSLAS